MNVAKQIIGSFEDIGKDVVREVAKVPKDIAGKALESLGTSSGQKPQGQTTSTTTNESSKKNEGLWEQFDTLTDKEVKKKIARKALEALLSRQTKPKEPSVWEKIQMEVEQKKQLAQQQQTQTAAQQLPKATSKRPRGDLYGVGAKRLGSELGKNIRQD
ncbi:MAG: hypothetical protein AAB803_02185 [Patescibacteria group bacterium]